ncbi:hypothetical protein O181_055834 [Austropuccinia psidii MF-1]|uniref:Integrase catalytic domain-containing protein n=1 Tax=Austropuccinia psidii MF-1 TaxID=1389203 RepID=A0A9Q3E7C4_9BASI|nr:hypothetical protein [Austropuccinia psidii MF-1]
MIHIQEPKSPWEVVHMDWVTELSPSCGKSNNSCLVIVDRYRKTPIFLPCHKDDTAMDTALLLWSRVSSPAGLFRNIISDRDSKFTSALWTNIHRLFGTKLSFYTAYHPQADGLAEGMIQALEDIIRRFWAYVLQLKDSYGLINDWCTPIPALEFAYKTSVHSFTGKTPSMLEKRWNPRIPEDTLSKDLVDIHPTSSRFKLMLDKVKHHVKQSPKKFEDSYVGPFVMVSLHGTNAVQVELSGEFENKDPTFQVSLINPYQQAEKELFPLRNPNSLNLSPVEHSEDKQIKKFIKQRRLRGRNQREYLVRYRNPVHEDELLAESEITDSETLKKATTLDMSINVL